MIIDSHFHFGYIEGYMNYDTSLDSALDVMNRLDITHAVNNNTRGLMFGDFQAAVDEDIDLFAKTGGRIMSYFSFNPNQSNVCLNLIKKYYDGRIFKGIKIHPSWHMVSGDDELFEAVWRYASENGIILISHSWDISLTNPVQELSFPAKFQKYLAKYPDVRFICAHSGGRYKGIVAAVNLAQQYRNMYLDTAGDIYANGYIEYAVRSLGSEKILFGSDYGMMDQRNMLGVVLGADISTADRDNILYHNAANLFGIAAAAGEAAK
jgi:uncharacterized protein